MNSVNKDLNVSQLQQIAKDMRRDVLKMCYTCGAQKGHLGGCMSAVDVLAVLYKVIMNIEAANNGKIAWDMRDRFVLSKGHAGMAMYAALKQVGVVSQTMIDGEIRGEATHLFRHPKRNENYAIECSVGSLGMGLGYGIGLAEVMKRKADGCPNVYVMIGDGECDEGSVWESAAYAGAHHIDNLIVIIDKNGLQLDGTTSAVLNIPNMAERWAAFGFETVEANGHDIGEILNAFRHPHVNKPLAIIFNTVKGKGVSFAEHEVDWHDNYLSEDLYIKALKELQTGEVDNSVKAHEEYSEKTNKLTEDNYAIEIQVDCSEAEIEKWNKLGSRDVVGAAMQLLSEQDDRFVLVYSDCGKRIHIEECKEKYENKFLQVGIAEQHQICMAAAMANEGYHVYAAAYAPFITARVLDQVRTNLGYMKSPVKLIGLGAGFASGDLGATHMAVEDIANMRCIPNMTVVAPADCTEIVKTITAANKMDTPVYIRLTADAKGRSVYAKDYDFRIGKAIKLCEGRDVAIISCGAIVTRVLEAAKILENKGISCAVINMHTIKPLDTRAIDELLDRKLLVTVEEHSIVGGLGSCVAEYTASKCMNIPIKQIGIPDRYFTADLPDNLIIRAGISEEQIAEQIMMALNEVESK